MLKNHKIFPIKKANYNIAKAERMRIGPFPGQLQKASFISFSYIAKDVLCLEELVLVENNLHIAVLQVRRRFLSGNIFNTKFFSKDFLNFLTLKIFSTDFLNFLTLKFLAKIF